MSTRAELIAACYAAGPADWPAAVTALGAASRAGFPVPKRRHYTGLNSGQLIYRMTESHVFDRDRAAIRARIPYANHSDIIDWLKDEVKARKQAEKATKQAA